MEISVPAKRSATLPENYTELINRLCQGDEQAEREILNRLLEDVTAIAVNAKKVLPVRTIGVHTVTREVVGLLLDKPGYENRFHIYGTIDKMTKRVLTGEIKRNTAMKRQGQTQELQLHDLTEDLSERLPGILDMRQLLRALQELDKDMPQILVSRIVGRDTFQDIADQLNADNPDEKPYSERRVRDKFNRAINYCRRKLKLDQGG